MDSGIYEIVNLHDGKATAYVGSSMNIKKRWRNHKSYLQRGAHRNEHLQRAWDKYGEGAFEWGVIEEVQDEANLMEREQYWLDRYLESPDTCYNISTIAGPGGSMPEETKCKIGAAQKGKKLTKEHKRKLSVAMQGNKRCLGYKQTEEHKHRLSVVRSGRAPWNKGLKTGPLSEEHRHKVSEALRGRVPWNKGKTAKGE